MCVEWACGYSNENDSHIDREGQLCSLPSAQPNRLACDAAGFDTSVGPGTALGDALTVPEMAP